MALLSIACASFMPATRSSGALAHTTAARSTVARSSGLVASASVDHSLLDQISSLHAAGLQGLIQATRDATQGAFEPIRTVAINVGLGALVFGATSAWTAGGRLREKRAELTEREFTLLFLCFCLDLAGDSSFVVGELGDLVWAPISALALKAIFGSTPLALLNFVKEALPFSDIVPVATLAWLLAIVYPESAAARLLGLDSMPKLDVEDGDPTNYFNPDRDKLL